VITADKVAAARLMRQQKRPMQAIAKALVVSRATLYRHLDPSATGIDREPAA
jgi:DNA-binding phage protein